MKKIIGILVVLLIICLYLIFNKEQPEIKTYTTFKIIDTESKVVDTKPISVKLVNIKVPVKEPFETKVTDTVWRDKEVKQYTYKDSLKNGILTSVILADNIYKRDVSLKTTDTIINTEVIRTLNKSQLFIGGTMNLSKDLNALNPTLSLYYNRRNKFILGTGVGISNNQANVNVTFAIKL